MAGRINVLRGGVEGYILWWRRDIVVGEGRGITQYRIGYGGGDVRYVCWEMGYVFELCGGRSRGRGRG